MIPWVIRSPYASKIILYKHSCPN